MIRFFAAHPTAANLVMIAFLVLGAFSAPGLRRDTFPRIQPSKVQITVAYPGARAEDIEESVCRRIEDAIDAVNQVDKISCEARESKAIAVVEMEEGGVLDRFTADIKSEIDAIDDFPEKVEKPIVKQLGQTEFVAGVAITGIASAVALKAYAEQVKTRMLQSGKITKVEILGFSDRQIRVSLKQEALRRLGISGQDVAAKIGRFSLDLPAGTIETRTSDVLVRFADERRTPYALGELVIASGPNGGQIKLRDVANISNAFELAEAKIIYNGQRAALLNISKSLREDTLKSIDGLRAFLKDERARAPPGVELAITNDGSSIVRDRLKLLIDNSIQALVLVFLTMWVFFGLRYSFWVAMGLPVSFAGGFAVMYLIDYSINMLTMVGLLITIGILMDDAIVISENVAAHRKRGKPPVRSAIDGTLEVMPSVVASFLTTACIFGSLAFLKGDIGQVLRVIPVVMLVVLTISLVEAFLILPNHLAHSMAHATTGEGAVQRRVNGFVEWAKDAFVGRFVDACIAWRYLTLGVVVLMFLGSVSILAGGLVKFVAFPELDGDTLEARILLPQGTPLERTEEVVKRVVAAARAIDDKYTPAQPGKQPLVRAITVLHNTNDDAYETGAHVATVRADLLSAEKRTVTSDAFLTAWREGVGDPPDVIGLKFTSPRLGPAGRPIDVQLQGSDLGELKSAATDLVRWFERYRGVYDVSDDLRPGKPEVRVRLKEAATNLGLDGRTIADQLRAAYFGTTVSEIQIGPESVEIDVRLQRSDKRSLAGLDDFLVVSSGGKRIPITSVATLERDRGYARINRVNGLRTVTIQGNVDVRVANAAQVVDDALKRFVPELKKKHPGIKLALEGQNKEASVAQRSMVTGFLIGLIGVFLLLSFQFRSYLEPVVVMLAIPMALIGVIVGHLVMGLDISMPSMLGFVSLAGIVVNNSILIVNFIKTGHEDGLTVHDAILQASRARFRAVLLTSVTTIVGLMPILAETSLQAQVLIPLVTSLAFGLMSSTLLVLVVVPAFYMVLDDFGLTTLEKPEEGRAAEPEGAQPAPT
jgi:hydrophobic/amphiphilic exporter-1 (mainly G- bacteria), HAE1 family